MPSTDTSLSSSRSSKIHRKSLKQPDEFMSSVKTLGDHIAENPLPVVIVIGVLFVMGVAFAIVSHEHAKKTTEASSALYIANRTLTDELTAIAAAEPKPAQDTASKADAKKADSQPNPESVAHKKLDVDASFGPALAQFKDVISKFDGTRPAYDARVSIANLYFNHGEPEKALSWYQNALKSAPSDFEKLLTSYSLGLAYENAGKPADAAQTYEKALSIGNEQGSLKGELLLGKARAYEAAHDVTKARSTYDQILSQLPNTDYAQKAEYFKSLIH